MALVRQAVRDLRLAIDWFVTQSDIDPSRVMVAGNSLNGYVALLTYLMDSKIAFGFFTLTPADFAREFWSYERFKPYKDHLERQGIFEEDFRRGIEPIALFQQPFLNRQGRATVKSSAHRTML